jgi:hypothetical protein
MGDNFRRPCLLWVVSHRKAPFTEKLWLLSQYFFNLMYTVAENRVDGHGLEQTITSINQSIFLNYYREEYID